MEVLQLLKILFIINITYNLVNGEITEIDLNNFVDFQSNGNKNFYVKTEKETNLPNYLKIQVDSLFNNDNNDNQFVISYYQQDSSFQERKQISQSFSNSTFIWLNKNQINKNFYFSVECSISNCSYNLSIYKIDYAELNLGEINNYYVTEENKDMTFLIKVNISKYFNDMKFEGKVTIWSRSGKKLNSTLKPQSSYSLIHDNYQGYLINYNIKDDLYKEYYLKVEGKIGDLINVGSLIFDDKNICPIIFKDIGTEITGFYKKDVFNFNCFKFSNISRNSLNDFIYDFYYPNIQYYSIENQINNYNLVCYNVLQQITNEDALFSIQFINNGKKKISLLSPQILGRDYLRIVEKGDIIGLIPFKPDDTFKFMTYYLMDLPGTSESYIYECNSYPFCNA